MVFVGLEVLASCSAVTTPDRGKDWDSYPQQVVRVVGPPPRLAAFLQPAALADSLPVGRYYVAVTWRVALEERVRLVPAGTIGIGGDQR